MGTLLRRLLRPATALFMRSGNAFKLPLIAATFTSSVAVAAWAQPFAWSSVPGALVAALWLAGIYLCAAFHVGSEEARAELRRRCHTCNRPHLHFHLLQRRKLRPQASCSNICRSFLW